MIFDCTDFDQATIIFVINDVHNYQNITSNFSTFSLLENCFACKLRIVDTR